MFLSRHPPADTFPLPFELWAEKYTTGQHLVTPSVRHLPPECLDPKIKARSRMHWYLADEQARWIAFKGVCLCKRVSRRKKIRGDALVPPRPVCPFT